MGEGVDHGRLALRPAHRLRGHRHVAPRRHAAAHLPHARRRQDLGAHHDWPARRRDRATSCARIRSAEGLLFAGTEQAVYVSFDDGDHWQSLRLNMPATSIRDLVIKDDDLVVAHARPRLLDPGRHHAAAADRRRGRWAPTPTCSSRRRRGGGDGTSGPTRRCRPTSRQARTRRTARSSTTHLKKARHGPGDARDPRRLAARWSRQYSSEDPPEAAGRGSQHPGLLDSAAAAAPRRRRPAPLRLGSALPAAGGRGLLLSDLGRLQEHVARAARAVGRCRASTACG